MKINNNFIEPVFVYLYTRIKQRLCDNCTNAKVLRALIMPTIKESRLNL